MNTMTLQATGVTKTAVPVAFLEQLKAASEKPASMAAIELFEILKQHLGLQVPKKGDCSYHWAPYLPDGSRRGGPRPISTTKIKIDGYHGMEANRVTDKEKFAPNRGSFQYQPVDYQLVINGVIFPPFQHLVPGDVTTPTGLRVPGNVPGSVRFTKGYLRLNPSTNKLLHAMIEMHPQNVSGFMNIAARTGSWPWLEVDVVGGDQALADWSNNKFWFKAEGRDEKELREARRAEEDARAIAAIDGLATSVMKSIAMACNAELPAAAIGNPDQRPFLVQVLKALVESRNPARDRDRARLADMVGGRHTGIQKEVEAAISCGAILIEGGEFILVEGTKRTPLSGVIVTANMAGREAEALALAIMQNESLEEFHARMRESARVMSAKAGYVMADEPAATVKEMLDRLIEVGVIFIDKAAMCWVFKTPQGHNDKIAYFEKTSNGPTRFAKLLAWAEGHDHTMARVTEAYEKII